MSYLFELYILTQFKVLEKVFEIRIPFAGSLYVKKYVSRRNLLETYFYVQIII